MVERGSLPDNPNSFANRVSTVRQSQLAGARDALADSRELQYKIFFKIDAAKDVPEKRKFGSDYRLGVLGVIDAAIMIADQKIREKKPLEDVPQELGSRTNSIKLALEIQLGKGVDQLTIRKVIEELGIHASIDAITDRLREVVKIDSEEEISREVVRKAVKITDHSVSLVKKIQKNVGVKDNPSEYGEPQPA